jgi:hypothetical protein
MIERSGPVFKTFAAPIVSAVTAGLVVHAGIARAEDKEVDWTALQAAKVSLESGLGKAQQKGKPISGKFELEDGKLQLSTYTVQKGKFSEVIVDHMSGKISKTEEIKEGEDYKDATAQNKAMAKAKKSLRSAVSKAVAANPGYRAVSAMPSLEQGKPVATVILQKEAERKTVSEKLD